MENKKARDIGLREPQPCNHVAWSHFIADFLESIMHFLFKVKTKRKKMNQKRKQELRQLLHEAIASLEIRNSDDNPLFLTIDEYRQRLSYHWTFQSVDSLKTLGGFRPHVVKVSTRAKLLDFIRKEFKEAIHEDNIQSACFILRGGPISGFPLDALLEHLLDIVITRGVEGAISTFDRCSQNAPSSFQYRALLEGITVEAEVQVFEGMRIVRLRNSAPELTRYLPAGAMIHTPSHFFSGRALLIIDAFISPVFYNPRDTKGSDFPVRVEVREEQFPNFNINDFYQRFCQALSLVGNSAVKISLNWEFLSKDELFHLERGFGYSGHVPNVWASSTEVGQSEIAEAKDLYDTLVDLDSSVAAKLQIPIERWIKSKVEYNPVDNMIDLGIAFEALYLSDIDASAELSFRLRLRAAWYLGKDKGHREELMKDLNKIYEWRSKSVHTGKIPNKTKRTSFTDEEVREFIEKSQDLCRQSIIKILEEGKFPDWNNLILG